jgi:hypothetical protein
MAESAEIAEFEEWYNSAFLFSRDPTSQILNSENKTIKAKYARICEVCTRLLIFPNKPIQELRKEIAMDMMVSMRCSLDYINYAKLVIAEWSKHRKV